MDGLFRLFRKPALWWVMLCAWGATLWWLSSRPLVVPDNAAQIPHIDKVAHAGYFFVGGVFFGLALVCHGLRDGRTLFRLVTLSAALAGCADEYHQSHVPNRSGNDPGDWLADVLGGAMAGAVVGRARELRAARRDP